MEISHENFRIGGDMRKVTTLVFFGAHHVITQHYTYVIVKSASRMDIARASGKGSQTYGDVTSAPDCCRDPFIRRARIPTSITLMDTCRIVHRPRLT